MTILIIFAFLAGVVTILSPCILPLLPVILAGGVGGGKSRPWGVVSGFILSFTFFTLSLSALVSLLRIPPESLRWFAATMVFIFGLVMAVPVLKDWFLVQAGRFTPRRKSSIPGSQPKGFWTGFTLGLSLGLVWAPCAGPIMASVITLAVSQRVNTSSVFLTLSYSLGTAVPLLLIMLGGKTLLGRLPFLTKNTAAIQRGFGILMILTSLALFTGLDRRIQSALLEVFPNYGSGLTAIEDQDLVRTELDKLDRTGEKNTGSQGFVLPAGQDVLTRTQGDWINSPPLTLEGLKGKVVLVDFWTYSCINCVRTLPYLRSWNDKFAQQGLVILGVHSPEFAFEKDLGNLKSAMKDLGVTWPVVQDNDFGIWNAFKNRYWPAHYLFDKTGVMVQSHFGEGGYAETEALIKQLLEDNSTAKPLREPELTQGRTAETYLGRARSDKFLFQGSEPKGPGQYLPPQDLPLGSWSLSGSWNREEEKIISEGEGVLRIHFFARNVYLVAGPAGKESVKASVTVDGKPAGTSDVQNGEWVISLPRMYHLFQSEDPREGILEIKVAPGTAFFAFTFG